MHPRHLQHAHLLVFLARIIHGIFGKICGASSLGCVDEYVEDQPEVLVLTGVTAGVITLVADGFTGSSHGPYRLTVTVDECDGAGDCEASEQCRSADSDHSRRVPS